MIIELVFFSKRIVFVWLIRNGLQILAVVCTLVHCNFIEVNQGWSGASNKFNHSNVIRCGGEWLHSNNTCSSIKVDPAFASCDFIEVNQCWPSSSNKFNHSYVMRCGGNLTLSSCTCSSIKVDPPFAACNCENHLQWSINISPTLMWCDDGSNFLGFCQIPPLLLMWCISSSLITCWLLCGIIMKSVWIQWCINWSLLLLKSNQD